MTNREQKQAQIKELAKVIFKNYNGTICRHCGSITSCEKVGYDECGICKTLAEILYDNDYRKVGDLRLYETQMKNGEIDMAFGSEDCTAFVYSILQIFKQNGGNNFVSTTLEVDGKELGGRYALTIQKVGGLTPIEKARKDTAKEILSAIKDIDDEGEPFRNYYWFERLCKQYGVEVDE